MKEQVQNAIKEIKNIAEQNITNNFPIKGCITGSCLLDYFEGQDVDIFLYDEKSFTKLLFALYYSPKFVLGNDLEQWKFQQYINFNDSSFNKLGLITIKFLYNTCVPINVIFKKKCQDIFSVVSFFDMDIVCKAYDLVTNQYLDLTGNSTKTKIADWNKWNPKYLDSENLWEMSKILRQLERCIKYYERGYNTDLVVKKYVDIINKIQNLNNIFKSEKFENRLIDIQEKTNTVKTICELWLATHTISEEGKLQLKTLINNL